MELVSGLKLSNFGIFCLKMVERVRKTVDFKAQPGRRDIDKHYYNTVVLSVLDEVITKAPSLQAHPAFDLKSSAYI